MGIKGGSEVGAGDPASALTAEHLFVSTFPSLCRTAALITGRPELAEEVVMEAFSRAVQRWDRVAAAELPVAYVRRSVVNLSISRVRRMGAERRAHARVNASTKPAPLWEDDGALDRQVVRAAVQGLPTRQRACVVLRYFDDLSEQDIAAAMGCSPGTVKSQLAKARAHLARSLDVKEP